MENGTILSIQGVKVKIIGKFHDGRIILQSDYGLQIWFSETDLKKVVDK